MAEALKDLVGQKLYLIDEAGKRSLEKFTLLQVDEKGVRLENKKGGKLRVHPSRVVLPNGSPAAPVPAMAKAPSPPKAKAPEKPKSAAPKTEPAEVEMPVFDLPGFVAGREHWSKKVKFDHSGYDVVSHSVIDEKAGNYQVFNTYKYPGSSALTLGKNSKGITPYPLKGHQTTYVVGDNAEKADSRGKKRTRKGNKTAEQVRKLLEKRNYKKV